MKNWEDSKYVLALERFGTTSAAAAALGVANTTITRRIERITEEFGAPLFHLENSRWSVTELGRTVSEFAEEMEKKSSKIHVAASNSTFVQSTRIRVNTVSFINSHFLAENVAKLTCKHPEINLVLDANDETKSLSKGEADISVRLSEPKGARLVRIPLCKLPISIFNTHRSNTRNWVGLPEQFDRLPEMRMAHEFFDKPPTVRVDSFSGIAKTMLATGFSGIVPNCIGKHFEGLYPTTNPRAFVLRETWCVYDEMNKGTKTTIATVEWLRGVLGTPRTCACRECTSFFV